jgi:hypothetical protein
VIEAGRPGVHEPLSPSGGLASFSVAGGSRNRSRPASRTPPYRHPTTEISKSYAPKRYAVRIRSFRMALRDGPPPISSSLHSTSVSLCARPDEGCRECRRALSGDRPARQFRLSCELRNSPFRQPQESLIACPRNHVFPKSISNLHARRFHWKRALPAPSQHQVSKRTRSSAQY